MCSISWSICAGVYYLLVYMRRCILFAGVYEGVCVVFAEVYEEVCIIFPGVYVEVYSICWCI